MEYFNSTSNQQINLTKTIGSKLWRMNNIYNIRDKSGRQILLRLNKSQKRVLTQFKHNKKIILKSRQQGISTLFLVYYLDTCLVTPGYQAGIQSYGQDEADKLAKRALFAWDEMDQEYKDFIGYMTVGEPLRLVTNNQKGMTWNNGATLKIGNFRGDTLQALHVSELGKIAKKYPEKARELKTGAFQAVSTSNKISIESTAEGNSGLFYDMWVKAEELQLQGKELTPLDFQAIFLSWVDDPDCSLDYPVDIPEKLSKYFEKLQTKNSIVLADTQKWWYVKKYEELGDDIKQEYPTTPEEAFEQTRDGSYYARLFRDLVKDKRLVKDPYDPSLKTHVAMDLGMNDTMVLVYYQVFRKEVRIIDETHSNGEPLSYYVDIMRSKKYNYGTVFVPHDAKVRELGTGKSRLDILKELGVRNIRVLPKQPVHTGIELVRKWLPHMWIKDDLVYIKDTFKNYTKQWDDRLGRWRDQPLHNEWSNPADAIRYMCQSLPEYEKDNYTPKRQPRTSMDL